MTEKVQVSRQNYNHAKVQVEQMMPDTRDDMNEIRCILQSYFDGLYYADTAKLAAVFHPDVWLKAPGKRRSLTQWLQDVGSRPVPAECKHKYAFDVLSIDVVQDQAMVKLVCPLFDFHYVDFLGLLKENEKWLIVSKMYTDVKPQSEKSPNP